LADQDRSKWNHRLIEAGNDYMNKAAVGNAVSPYHIEAAISYEHCLAESFDRTNWNKILELYDWLCRISPSPVAYLNRVVAVMKVLGPEKALSELHEIPGVNKLESFYLYYSLAGEIYLNLNQKKHAIENLRKALELTQSESEKKLLMEKISGIR
jgi:RNA polymerase sigma-70 factor (ECF subfamily)